MPLLAGLCFGAVLALNELTGMANERLLGDVQSSYMPALELSRTIEVDLVDLQRKLQDAVGAADQDALHQADQSAAGIARQIHESEAIRAFRPGELRSLESDITSYYGRARNTSVRMIQGESSDSLQSALERLGNDYTSIHARIEGFTARQRSEMDAALEHTRDNHRRSVRTMTVALFLGLIALGLLSRGVILSTTGALRRAVADATALSGTLARTSLPVIASGDEVSQLVGSLQSLMMTATESELRLNEAQRLAHVGSWEWDALTSEITWSEELYRIVGHPKTGRANLNTLFEHVHPDDRARVEPGMGIAFAGAATYRNHMRIVRSDGDVRTILVHNEVVADENGAMTGCRGVVQDVTEIERTASALRNSEERYRALFAHNPMPMWVFDSETLRFLAVNGAAVIAYGYSEAELLAMTIADIRPAEDSNALDLALADVPPGASKNTVRHRRKDGSVLDVDITSHGVSFNSRPGRLVLANDITEKRRLEQQLRQSQKMDAIGRLAGGVAHDFNNVLNVIMGYSEIIARRLPAGDALRPKVAEILKAVDRASGLTHQLLAFSRKQILQPRLMDLNVVVADMDNMLRRLIGENIDVRTRLAESLSATLADPGQIEQVIMNLAVNARDAMPDGGTLVIETRDVELDELYTRAHPGALAGRYTVLSVGDTGCGMDTETQSRVFEPFFTTKEEGKGTGLGLATVYGIVEQSGGRIEVDSVLGHGTTFKIYFPRAEGRPLREIVGAPLVALSRGSETVLVVEDDNLVRCMIRETLEHNGYRVLEAETPWQALAMAESHKGSIDIVLTDLVMPGMNGSDLADRLKPLRPGAAIVFMSGYTEDAIGHYNLAGPNVNFIQKPFTSEKLLMKLRDSLESLAQAA
jgi:two-component system, cell cycle sensor histidine kinase and response regulator CckA